MKHILFCVTLDLSNNLTEMRQISLREKRDCRITGNGNVLPFVKIVNVICVEDKFTGCCAKSQILQLCMGLFTQHYIPRLVNNQHVNLVQWKFLLLPTT